MRLRRKAARILNASGSTDVELSLVFTDDEEVQRLNSAYRGKNTTTDVLSFAVEDPTLPGEMRALGDVVISVEQALRQAPDDLESELLRLVAHGLCHLLGYDHQNATERKTMSAEECRLLGPFGISCGLIDKGR